MNDTEPAIHIEFIAEGTEYAPFILVWGYDIAATRELFHALRALRLEWEDEIAIHALPRFAGVEGVELYAQRADSDRGIIRRGQSRVFDWQLTPEGWQNVEGVLGGFCGRHAAPGGYDSLESHSEIEVIFSTGR